MYAVVKNGGKQYKVAEGDSLKIEKVDAEVGSKIELGDVLALGEGEGMKIGSPTVEGARVLCEVTGHGKDKKIVIFKKKRRKGYSKKQGHRQQFTALKVDSILEK